jgi:hypothetical protein
VPEPAGRAAPGGCGLRQPEITEAEPLLEDFRPRDLYPTGVAGEIGVFALVTIDEQDDGWHICFTQDSGPESGSVTNAVERLATAVYREARAHAFHTCSRVGRSSQERQVEAAAEESERERSDSGPFGLLPIPRSSQHEFAIFSGYAAKMCVLLVLAYRQTGVKLSSC